MQPVKLNITVHSIFAAMMLAIVAVELRAQSAEPYDPPATQPSRAMRAQWTGTVTAFAAALRDSTDTQTIHELVGDDVIIRQFNRAGRQGLTHLREQVNGTNFIMSRTYMQTPTSMATDMANAIKDVSLPDEVKRRLTPGDEAAHKRANAIASKWIGASLFTNGNEPVAVIVLWSDQPVAATQPADPDAKDTASKAPQVAMPVFILLKGDIVGDRVQISQICYGDPLPFDTATTGDDSTASGD